MTLPTKAIIKLTWGTATLDLNSVRYKVSLNFIPPPLSQTAYYAEGTSQNRTGGATLIGTKAQNRKWSFGLHIVPGSSEADIRRGIADVQAFLNNAGDDNNPVYLEFRPNSDVAAEPLWGQTGANYRFEVTYGIVEISPQFGKAPLRTTGLPDCRVTLTLKPFAIGRRQRAAHATGGVLEDWIGTSDGLARGTIVPAAVTNKMTNPIFGGESLSDWNILWISGANITVTKNTDPRFFLFGVNSVKIVRNQTAAGATWVQSIAAGNTNAHVLSCYAKRPDGAAIAGDIVLYYNGSNLATTYTNAGNGWYRLTASLTGVVAAADCGCNITTLGTTFYVDGFQLEEASFATPLCYGDLIGCAWTSTPSQSTSTRTASQLKVPIDTNTFDVGQGTIRIAWRAGMLNSDVAGGSLIYFFDTREAGHTASLQYVFLGTEQKFRVVDGVNSVTSTSTYSWALNEIQVFHVTWSSAGMVMYRNGVSIGSGSTYLPPSPGSNLFIGGDYALTQIRNALGTFMDFSTYQTAMTAAEVQADYTNLSGVLADGQRLSPIPYLWSKAGDGLAATYYDATHFNYVVAAGVPGDVPALTELTLTEAAAIYGFLVSNFTAPINHFYSPANFFSDQSGTATAATDVGSAVKTTSVNTATVTIASVNFDLSKLLPLLNAEYLTVIRVTDAGANLQIREELTAPFPVTSPWVGATSDAANRILGTTSSMLFLLSDWVNRLISPILTTVTMVVSAYRTVVGAANVLVDFMMILPRPLMKIVPPNTGAGSKKFLYKSNSWEFVMTSSADVLEGVFAIGGDAIELAPNKLNTLLVATAPGVSATAWDITWTLTFSATYLTPRYSIL